MITLVTITFNNFEELEKTLKSISPLEGLEIIVVNGGSCSRTRTYLDHWVKNPSVARLVAINEPDSGIADAFNKGIQHSTGDAIVFLNSGDQLLRSGFYQESDRFLRENPHIDFIHGDVLFEDQICGDMQMPPRLCSLGRGMPYYHQTMVVRKKIFTEIGPFKHFYKIAMDFEFICRMERHGHTHDKGFYDRRGPIVRMDGKGVSAVKERESIRECYLALKENGLIKGFLEIHGRGIARRFILFKGRELFLKVGLRRFLGSLKKFKNQRLLLKGKES